jgi:cytochrome b561
MSNSLGEFHHAEEAETKSNRIIHWVIALIVVAGIGVYAFESGMFNPEVAQTAKTYPRGL